MKDPYKNRVRVAAAQYFVRPVRSFEQFADQVAAVVETAAGYRSRLLVLPEYFTMQLAALHNGRRRAIRDYVRDVAGYLPDYLVLLAGLAREHELYIVGGTIPVEEGGKVYNDCHVFGPSGDYAVQGKLHMTRFEREDWDVQPRDGLKVFDTALGKLAVAICYDVEFPELVRTLALEGVSLLAVPSNTDDRQGFLRVRYCAHARTIENQLYVVHSATVGSLPRVPDLSLNYGQAAILTPSDFTFSRDGVMAQGVFNQEDMVIGELDMQVIEESRTFGTVLPLYDSRRSEAPLYPVEHVAL